MEKPAQQFEQTKGKETEMDRERMQTSHYAWFHDLILTTINLPIKMAFLCKVNTNNVNFMRDSCKRVVFNVGYATLCILHIDEAFTSFWWVSNDYHLPLISCDEMEKKNLRVLYLFNCKWIVVSLNLYFALTLSSSLQFSSKTLRHVQLRLNMCTFFLC